jgi:hypothetical protein
LPKTGGQNERLTAFEKRASQQWSSTESAASKALSAFVAQIPASGPLPALKTFWKYAPPRSTCAFGLSGWSFAYCSKSATISSSFPASAISFHFARRSSRERPGAVRSRNADCMSNAGSAAGFAADDEAAAVSPGGRRVAVSRHGPRDRGLDLAFGHARRPARAEGHLLAELPDVLDEAARSRLGVGSGAREARHVVRGRRRTDSARACVAGQIRTTA